MDGSRRSPLGSGGTGLVQDRRMRSKRSAAPLFLFSAFLLFGCGATAAPPAPSRPAPTALATPDSEGHLTLAVAGQASVAPGIVLTLERVVSDSRCPVDVTCVWAGEIRIALALESPQSEAPRLEFELTTTAPKATARGLEIELLGALPAPHSKKTIAPADYRVSLRAGPASGPQPGPGPAS
jgi:hypothetical protein